MAGRCGRCGGARAANSHALPAVIGDETELTLRVWVVGHGGLQHHPLLEPGTAVFVNGDGVQALLDTGVLTLA